GRTGRNSARPESARVGQRPRESAPTLLRASVSSDSGLLPAPTGDQFRRHSPMRWMSPSRREVLIQLAALAALPLPKLTFAAATADPLDGTIADYQAGRRRGEWTAAEITARALERCRQDGARWRAIDALSATALSDARAADERLRAGR